LLEFNHEPGRFFQTDTHDQLLAQLTYTILAADIVSIDQVFVAPAYRGQQIATQLVSPLLIGQSHIITKLFPSVLLHIKCLNKTRLFKNYGTIQCLKERKKNEARSIKTSCRY